MKHIAIILIAFMIGILAWATMGSGDKTTAKLLIRKYKGAILLLFSLAVGLGLLFVFAVKSNPLQLF